MIQRIYFLILFLSLTSFCEGQNPYKNKNVVVSDRKASEIDSIAIFKPISIISSDGKENDTVLCLIAKQNLLKGTNEILQNRITISNFDVPIEYQQLSEKVLFHIIKSIDDGNYEKATPFIKKMIEIMDSQHINYALAILQIGSSPHRETEDASVKIKTVLNKSAKSYSFLMCVILDRQKKNVAYFGKSDFYESEPCIKKNTDEQLIKIFKKYFKN